MEERIIQAADLVVGDIIVNESGRQVPVESVSTARDWLVTVNEGQGSQMRGFAWEHVTVLRAPDNTPGAPSVTP